MCTFGAIRPVSIMQVNLRTVQWSAGNVIRFLKSEYFLDALRVTLSIIIPFAVFYEFLNPPTAITVGVGALLISLTDSPGTFNDKIVMSVSSLCTFFLVSLVTALLINSIILSALLIIVLCIVFSLFTAFGKRYALLGTMGLIIMTFVQGLKPADPLSFSFYIAVGGLSYYLVSLIQTRLWPLSSVRHALGECILSTADYMKAKADFYRPDSNLEECYLKIIKLHNKVSEKQEQLRDLLLRNRQLMRKDHEQGQRFLLVSVQVIDLYELISAIHYDYENLRQNLKGSGLLEAIGNVIDSLARDLRSPGLALSAKSRVKPADLAVEEIANLKEQIAEFLKVGGQGYSSILMKLSDNIDDIYAGLKKVSTTLTSKFEAIYFPSDLPEYQLFTSAEGVNLGSVKSHLTLRSPILRFAFRLSLACIVAFGLTLLPVGLYSYWILLTVIVIIKPSFGHSKKRNIERLKGTIGGVLIGIMLLATVENIAVKLVLSALFLLGYFVYLRVNYALSVTFLTPMVIICLSIYNDNSSIVTQRVFDTLIGCGIAFAASYLFPSWEVKRHAVYMSDVIKANLRYLRILHDQSEGIPADITSFKLARKNVYTRLAILSSGVQNMLLEPKHAQGEVKHLYKFEILSHQLSSIIASFFPFSHGNRHLEELKGSLAEAMHILENSHHFLDAELPDLPETTNDLNNNVIAATQPDHLEYHKVQQILRISKAIKVQVEQYRFRKP